MGKTLNSGLRGCRLKHLLHPLLSLRVVDTVPCSQKRRNTKDPHYNTYSKAYVHERTYSSANTFLQHSVKPTPPKATDQKIKKQDSFTGLNFTWGENPQCRQYTTYKVFYVYVFLACLLC